MSWRTHRLTLRLRSLGRRCGTNKVIARLLTGSEYERLFQRALIMNVRQGDCVWDVGANLGYYTKLLAERVGPGGSVFAFEPSPVNFLRLVGALGGLKNVNFMKLALGRRNCRVLLSQGEDELGATSRIVEKGVGAIGVEVRSGVSLIADGVAAPPNVVKIDVEGYELEVLLGLGEHLRSATLRALGVEVHFGMLEKMGTPDAPKQIEDLLLDKGLSVTWPDKNHIIAARR